MLRLRDLSIKYKLTVLVLLTCSIALLVASAVFIYADRMSMRNQMVLDVQILADVIGANSTAAIAFDSEDDATEVLGALRAEPHIISACIYTFEGQQFAYYHRDSDNTISLPSEPEPAGHYFHADGLSMYRTIMLGRKPVGTLFIRSDMEALKSRQQRFVAIVVIAFLISTLVAFIVISRLQQVVSKPIKHLAGVAARVSAKRDYSLRAREFGRDEIGFLIGMFNEMLSNIQQRDVALQEARSSLETRVKERTAELESEISDRISVEIALRESEDKYRTLFDTANDAIFVMKGPTFIDCNRCTLDMFGCERDHIIGQSPFRFSPAKQPDGEDSTSKGAEYVKLALSGKAQFFEWKHFKLDGTPFDAEVNLNRMELDGEVLLLAIVRDITVRKRADVAQAVGLRVANEVEKGSSVEQILGSVRDQLCAAIDTTNFYVALYHAESDQYSFPYSTDEFDGADFPMKRIPNSLTDYVRRTGKPLLADEEIHRKLTEDGEADLVGTFSPIWLGVPLMVSGEAIGVMTVQDYTDRNKLTNADLELMVTVSEPVSRVLERMSAEEQRQQLQDKLERAERMESLGVLAGGVAHDLNNMLGPVVGYAELIQREVEVDSKLGKRVERISKSARDAADVIQDLLTLARRGRYEMCPTDLNEVVASYIDSPGHQKLVESRKDIRFELGLDESISRIEGSAPHLSKVVMNLIVNACDAMKDGGELFVSTSQQSIESLPGGQDEVKPGEYSILRVKDTGMGIDPRDLDKIFEPYYSKKKMGVSGSGLGLSVVYGVVKDHKGYYDIFSKVGEGTEFLLYFPVTNAAVTDSDDAESGIDGTESVLIVDDVREQREVAADILSSLGYGVTTMNGGREAVRYLKNHEVDIVVLDMIMEQGFDGLDTYREILQINPQQKAIIVSGYSATDRVEQMQDLGAGTYIKKPYSMNTLGKAIREELDRTVKFVST